MCPQTIDLNQSNIPQAQQAEAFKCPPNDEQLRDWLQNRKEMHQDSIENFMFQFKDIIEKTAFRIWQASHSEQDIELFSTYMENIAIGLYSQYPRQHLNDFIINSIKYSRKEEFDLPLLLSLWIDGAEAFSKMQLDCYHQDKAEVLSEKKYQKKEQKDSLLERCFQEVWNYDVKNNYKGKGQGSGCSFFYNNCPKLKNSCNHKVFCQKYAEWKKRTEPVAGQKIPAESLAECKKDGILCTKKP